MIEMRLLTPRQGGAELFLCPVDFWNFMLQLGETFGWKPHGASYVMTPIKASTPLQPAKRDYQPGARRDAKVVSNQDATQWANALSAARASKHLDQMIAANRPAYGLASRRVKADDPTLSLMDKFILYLRKGAFSFATNDVDNVTPIRGRS